MTPQSILHCDDSLFYFVEFIEVEPEDNSKCHEIRDLSEQTGDSQFL